MQNVVAFSQKHLCMYANIRVIVASAHRGAGGGHPYKRTIWYGPFPTEQFRTEWRSGFEQALEANGKIECDDIRCLTQGRKTTPLSPFDIDPRATTPEDAVALIPTLVLDDVIGEE